VYVRDARQDDLSGITALYNAGLETTTRAWTEIPYTVSERETWLAAQQRSGWPAIVAVQHDDVVGCASYADFRDSVRWPGYRRTVEHSIHVREDHWRAGIGRAPMSDLMTRASQAGLHVMVGGIDADNVGSIRFHERLGFVEVARMPEVGEKFGQRLDLVLVQRILDASLV